MKDTVLEFFGVVFGVLIVIGIIAFLTALEVLTGGLIFWGIGALAVYAFELDLSFSFLHGVATYLIFSLFQILFKGNTK